MEHKKEENMDRNGCTHRKKYVYIVTIIIIILSRSLLFSHYFEGDYLLDSDDSTAEANLTNTLHKDILHYTTRNIIYAPKIDYIKGMNSACFYVMKNQR